jgi:hypothetical protein
VLFGDLVRFLLDEVRAHGAQSVAVQKAIELLERAADSPDARMQELLVASFLENLEPDDPSFPELRNYFGPRLDEEYRKYRAALDPP